MKKGIIYVYFNRAKYEKEGIEKYYVGQTVKTMEERAGKDGKNYHWTNPNCNTKFANSIRKWGWNSFEYKILEEVYEEDLDELEKFYIEYFDSFKNGYNTTLGGEGIRGYNPYTNKTEEEIEKIKEKMSKSQNKRFENEEEREKLSKSQKKRFENEEEREKLSKTQNKRFENEEEKEKMSVIIKKRFEDPKIREKMSKSQKKRFENEEEKEKQSKAQKKRFENEEEIEKQSKAQKKRFENEEEREKMSEIQRKCWENKEYREKQNIVRKKCWEDKERRKKLSEKMSIISKKRFQDKSEREKCSQPGELNPYSKKVYCDTLNIIFSYVELAKKYCINILNSKANKIGAACNGKRKSSGKLADGTELIWKYIENVDKEILDNAIYIDSKKYEEIINERKKCGISCELNPNEKNVYCNELNILFSHIRLAEKYCKNVLNSKIGRIRYACDGKIRYSGTYNGIKLTWNWTENLDKEILNNAEYIDDKCYEEIINGNKKYLENPEIKKIQNERLLCEKHGNTKSVYCKELDIVFSYTKLATEYCKNVLNIKIGSISLTCNGKRKSTGVYNGKKLHWSWIENVDKKTLNNAEYIDSKKYEEIINEKINN